MEWIVAILQGNFKALTIGKRKECAVVPVHFHVYLPVHIIMTMYFA